MASIQNANLQIDTDENKQKSTLKITATIQLSEFECCLYQKCPSPLRLQTKIYGDDPGGINPDDHLFNIATQKISEIDEKCRVHVSYSRTVDSSKLDEDPWYTFPWDADEIYAKLILVDTYTGRTTSAKTNVVTGKF